MRTRHVLGLLLLGATHAFAATPDWLRSQTTASLPPHEPTTDAVLMYSDTTLTVLPNGSMKRLQRIAYKILRPSGEQYGIVRVHYDPQTRINFLRAWSIPATGKDYEVKAKEVVETALFGAQNGELVNDLRTKMLRIPAATPGSIVGYEFEQDVRPYMQLDEWHFQDVVPARDVRYTLQLPTGWTYTASWLNHPEQAPQSSAPGRWQWTLNNLKALRIERGMPPWRGIAGRMVVALQAPKTQDSGMQSWRDIGQWYLKLAQDRRDSSPEIKRQVTELTASATSTLQKMQALAGFVQSNIRYVSIQLGIAGYQPDRAIDVFANRFGDCKDKVNLLQVMLKEIGIESYFVIINTERGSVNSITPPTLAFNHVVMAIALPPDVEDPSLLARSAHPKLGKLLFFDPTDTLTPLGRLSGGLQENYGILVTPEGGELIALPRQPSTSNAVERTVRMTLDEKGTLRGDVVEVWVGDQAAAQRYAIQSAPQATDHIKPVEAIAAESFASFYIEKAAVANARAAEKPFEWHYTLEAPNYAKLAGDLLLVRPRVLGSKSSNLLETKEPRTHSIEFERPQRDHDVFEIALPNGFEVEEIPRPLNIDEGFISYQSKTEVVGRKLRYTRTFEIKELSVPVDKAAKLKQFYRSIENDERNLAVLKRTSL